MSLYRAEMSLYRVNNLSGVARYPAKFMDESSFYDILIIPLFYQKIINMLSTSALHHKFCRVSGCAYESPSLLVIAVFMSEYLSMHDL